jgi:transposase-like protein
MGRRIDAALHAVWRRRWERYEGSSVTVAEFCRREGVSQATFYQWRKRLAPGATAAEPAVTSGAAAVRGRTAVPHSGQAAFVELALAPAAVVEIELPNGVRVRVPADREQALRAAIRAAGELVSQAIDPVAREASSC